MDWNSLTPAMTGPVGQVVANPPYRRLGTGRMNPDGEEAAARHEVLGSLASAARTAARLIGKGGRFTVVYPSSRLGDLMAELNALKFQPKRLRMVHGRHGLPARLVLVEARAGGRSELRVDPPLFVFEKGRTYTSEVQDILSGWAWGAEP
jgi:tRNA1Val (adenine37-N6)-methyltransferase